MEPVDFRAGFSLQAAATNEDNKATVVLPKLGNALWFRSLLSQHYAYVMNGTIIGEWNVRSAL
jgi:hypothetical protein